MTQQRPTSKPEEIIVIGAGMAGLSVAARLAKIGHRVSLYESSNRVGGKCRTEVIEGFSFDLGPSLLTLPAVYRDLFLKTGKRIEHLLEFLPVDPSFTYLFHDGKHVTFPNLSHNGTVEAIRESFGDDAARSWHQLLSRAERMWDASREVFIEKEIDISTFFRRRNFFSDLMTIAPWRSLRSLTSSYSANPYLQKIIDRYATYTGSDPRKVPAVLLTIAFVEEAFGAWHIRGGLGRLPQELEKRCSELGVKIILNSRVEKIRTHHGAATGITLADGTSIDADIVIANADVNLVYNHLLPHDSITAKPRRSLQQSTSSLSGFTIALGLSGTSNLSHHTVLFPENYDDEFDSIFTRKEPVRDPAIYICNPKDSEMVPSENHEAWTILINAPRHEPKDGCDWNQPGLKEKYAEEIIDLIEKRGIKVRDRIKVMKVRTPADLEKEHLAPGGSIYGTSSNGARSAFLRAKNRSPIRNLYCVGGSTHPGGGLPLVGISAEIVANAIAAKERASQEI